MEQLLHLLAVYSIVGVLVIAAQQIGEDALEAAGSDGLGRLLVRVVAFELWALGFIQQEIVRGWFILPDWQVRIEMKTIIFRRRLEDVAVIVDVELLPIGNRFLFDAL